MPPIIKIKQMNYKPDNEELEILFPVECKEHKNFYYYPENKDIVINKNGDCIKLSTNTILIFYNAEGSYRTNNLTISKNKRKIISQHRILARTFIGRPKRHWDKSFDELEVNHIDGNKRNNSLDNLEWVTYAENRNHAYETGLHISIIKVLSRNVLTNEIKVFRSISECANHFNINIQTFTSHLNSTHIGKKIKHGHVFKFDDNTNWPVISNYELTKLGNKFLAVLARNLLTGEIKKFNSIADCTRYFKLSRDVLKDHLKTDSSGKYYKDNYVFKYDNNKPWKEYHPVEMRELGEKGISIVVKNTLNNSISIYESYVETAKNTNIDIQLLKYHLKTKTEYNKDNFIYSKLL